MTEGSKFPAITGGEVSDKTPGKTSGTGHVHETMHSGEKGIDGQAAGKFDKQGHHDGGKSVPDMPSGGDSGIYG